MYTRSPIAALAVVLLAVAGGGGAASADVPEESAALVEEALHDAAEPIASPDDRIVAEVADVRAVIPETVDDPLTIQAAEGAQVALTLPAGDAVTTVDHGEAAVTHERADGSHLVPVFRNNGVLQVLSVLTDETSPTSFTYGVTVDSGGALVPQSDGGVSLIDGLGEEIAMIAPPWAKDAEGRDIPTRFEVDGIHLTQIIDTASVADISFPVVADPAVSTKLTKYTVVDLVKTNNWTNKARQLGVCKVHAGAGGGRCTISTSYSVDTTISASLGASPSEIAASIGFSLSATVSGTISWTSKAANVGKTYKAWAVGTRATYRIKKWTGYKTLGMSTPNWKVDSTSGTLSSFSPVKGFAVGT